MLSFWHHVGPKPIRGLLAGAAGGLLSSWIMNQFQSAWSKVSQELEDAKGNRQQQRDTNQSSEEREDATMKAAGKIAPIVLGRELSKEDKKKAGPIVHYAFGTLAGSIYGLLSEYTPVVRLGFGTGFGAALFLIADEIAVPASGLSKKPAEYPLSSHMYGLAAHFVYGVSTEAVRQSLLKLA